MRLVMALLVVLFSSTSFCQEVFKIEVGKDFNKYNQSDLQRRVWELERAVSQLQQKVFQIETSKQQPSGDTWVCTISAMGDTYTGTGASKATAKASAVQSCKNGRAGDGFFCKDPTCEQ